MKTVFCAIISRHWLAAVSSFTIEPKKLNGINGTASALLVSRSPAHLSYLRRDPVYNVAELHINLNNVISCSAGTVENQASPDTISRNQRCQSVPAAAADALAYPQMTTFPVISGPVSQRRQLFLVDRLSLRRSLPSRGR